MLAAAAQALLQALREHRDIAQVVRAVAPLPQLDLEELLKRYASDAPALYVLPGRLRVDDDMAVLTYTVAGVVRNVAGAEQAFAGDGLDIGADHLLILATRAIHGHSLGGCGWSLVSAEMEDDPLFDGAGVAAVAMTFESSRMVLPADFAPGELDDFRHFHADIDIAPLAGAVEYESWLAEPADYSASRPDAQLDVLLQGAS